MRRRPPLSRLLSVVIAFALTLMAEAVTAKDLGVRGAVWRITEPDLLLEIEARLKAMETTGELARMRREALDGPGSASRRPARLGRPPRARPPHPSVRSFRHA